MKTNSQKKKHCIINLRKSAKPIALCITALFIMSMLSALSFSAVQAATVGSFGNTAKGSSAAWQSSGVMVASTFTAQTSGTANSISVYISNPTGTATKIKCAIYSETAKTLLATTEEKTVTSGFNGWQTLDFAAGPSLTGGASYSLVVWMSGNGNLLYYTTGAARQSWYASISYGNYPNGPYSSFTGYGQENNVYSIYCTIGGSSTTSPSDPEPTSDPTPSPNQPPTATPVSASSNGQLILYYNGGLYDGYGNPSAVAIRIAQAAQTYGNPQWLVIGNGAISNRGVANMPIPSAFITYMHNHGVKVMSHCHTAYGSYSESVVKAQIDYQMAYGPNIDGFEMDETNDGMAYYYTDLGNYVKSKNSNLFYSMNTGMRDISDGIAGIDSAIGLDGWVNCESGYYYFANHGGLGISDIYSHATPLIAKYPQGFAGVTSNWYIWELTVDNPAASYILSPNARTYPMTESQAVTLVKEAWSEGIYYFGVLWDSNPNSSWPSGDCSGLPTWWEDFLSQI